MQSPQRSTQIAANVARERGKMAHNVSQFNKDLRAVSQSAPRGIHPLLTFFRLIDIQSKQRNSMHAAGHNNNTIDRIGQ